MAQRRYFLLQESIPATEIGSFMCRVVASKTSPLTKFAPFSHPGAPTHNTNDIISSILPEPSLSTNCKEFLSVVRGRGVLLQLSALFKVQLNRSEEESRTLESQCVKRYSLANPDHYFQELMKNESYSRDVHALLEDVWSRRAYLVTGFLTATDSTWTIETNRATKNGFDITLPISAAVSVPVPGLADVGISPELSNEARRSRQLNVVEEEIFAVSYSEVKLSHKFTRAGGFFAATPTIGRPKRARAHHLALGHGDDDDDIVFESDDDVDVSKSGTSQGQAVIADSVILEPDDRPLDVSGDELYIDFA